MKEKSIKANAVLNMTKTISSIIFPLITFPYVSRILTPENIGKVNFGASIVSYFTMIASLGITTYAIRECSAKRDDKNELSKTASQIFSINIITTIIAYILMTLMLLFFSAFDSYKTLIIIQSTAILFTTLGCDWLNSAMEDFIFITVRTIFFQIISLVLMFVFIHEPKDYIKYTAITVIASSGSNLVNICYRKKFCTIKFVRQMKWKKHFKPIALLFVMLLAQTVFNSADVTMLGLLKGDYEVGLYSTAVKITNLVSQVIVSLLWVAMPRLSKYFADGDFDNINEMLKRIFQAFITLGLPSAVGCVCLAKEIIVFIAGNDYVGAEPSLIILMIAFLFNLVGSSFLGNMVLLPAKREGTFMMIFCISTVVNIVLNYLMIPLGGSVAASITTAFSYFLILIMCVFTKDKKIRINGCINTVISSGIGCIVIVGVCIIIKSLSSNSFFVLVFGVMLSVLSYGFIQMIMRNEFANDILNSLRYKLKKKEND